MNKLRQSLSGFYPWPGKCSKSKDHPAGTWSLQAPFPAGHSKSLHPAWENIHCPAIRNSDVHQCHCSHWTPIHISSCSFSFNTWPSVNPFTPHQQLHHWNHQHKYQCTDSLHPQNFCMKKKQLLCDKNRAHFHFWLQELLDFTVLLWHKQHLEGREGLPATTT